LIVAFSAAASGEDLNNNELRFTGTISSIETNGDGVRTLLVHTESLEVRVGINAATDVQDTDGDELEIDSLAAGNSIQVTGKYSSDGVVASSVQLLDRADNAFKLRGDITGVALSGSNLIISLFGVPLVVTPDTRIRSVGEQVSTWDVSDLNAGVNVQADGIISGTAWTAGQIKILSTDSQKERLTFGGTVASVAPEQIRVHVTGAGNVIPVLVTANTKTIGDVQVGSDVEVRGYLNTDLSVTARTILLLSSAEARAIEKKAKAARRAFFVVKPGAFAQDPLASAAGSTAPDATPTAILTNALNAVGGASLLQQVRDFTAKGEISFYWAGEEVHTTAAVYASGADRFRLDADMPEGVRSFVVTRLGGLLKNADGTFRAIPLHNSINLGILPFPHIKLLSALTEGLTKASLVGTSTVNDRVAYQVRVQQDFPKEFDPEGALTGLCKTDYLVDAETGLILKSVDMTHPDYTMTEDFAHELEFDNYVGVNGISLPGLIREKIIGQTVWELRLTDFAFNAGVTNLTFALSQ
jgi:hypothetical protein